MHWNLLVVSMILGSAADPSAIVDPSDGLAGCFLFRKVAPAKMTRCYFEVAEKLFNRVVKILNKSVY